MRKSFGKDTVSRLVVHRRSSIKRSFADWSVRRGRWVEGCGKSDDFDDASAWERSPQQGEWDPFSADLRRAVVTHRDGGREKIRGEEGCTLGNVIVCACLC